MRQIFASLLYLSFLPALLSAQTSALRGPDGGTQTRISSVDVLPLPGAPFSATSTITWTRTAGEGASVVTYGIAKVFRDSQGRVYRERHHFSPNPNVDPRTTLFEFSVRDPLAHTLTVCTRARGQRMSASAVFRAPNPIRRSSPFHPATRCMRSLRQTLSNTLRC